MTRTVALALTGLAFLLAGCARQEGSWRGSPGPVPVASVLRAPVAPSRSVSLWEEPDEAPQVGGKSDNPFGLLVGIRPLVKLERSKVPEMLEMDGPLAYELGLLISEDTMMGRFSLTYAPMQEEDSERPVHAYWMDWTGGFVVPVWEGPVTAAVRWEFGPSLLFMDYEKSTYDTVAVGGAFRLGAGLYLNEYRAGLEVSGDVRGWAGLDSHDVQTAWGYTLGADLFIKF